MGPPGSGNGGYTAGRLASHVGDGDGGIPVSVTLRQPPPLDVSMRVEHTDQTRLLLAGSIIAQANPGKLRGEPVEPVEMAVAAEAESTYRGRLDHPFPTCFTCGTGRQSGDALRLMPGLFAPGRTACVWVPDSSLAAAANSDVAATEFAWAALDCPGGWTSDLDVRPLVLGQMTALCDEPPLIGQPHVIVGQLLAEEGRKTFTATTLYDDDGRVLGRAEHVWIAVDPATFGSR